MTKCLKIQSLSQCCWCVCFEEGNKKQCETLSNGVFLYMHDPKMPEDDQILGFNYNNIMIAD